MILPVRDTTAAAGDVGVMSGMRGIGTQRVKLTNYNNTRVYN